MSVFLKLSFLFFIGSLLGWGLEVIFRRFFASGNPERKWINPGFLVGPYLPIYGFGLCTLYLLASTDHLFPTSAWYGKAMLFLLMAVCMTAIEFIAGIVFVRHMKVKLWDYSNEWGNLMGIVCPRFSVYWAILGAVYYFLVHPHILDAIHWLASNLAFSFVLGFFYGVLVIDVAYSAQIVAKVRAFAKENDIVVRYEGLRQHLRDLRKAEKKRPRFLLSLHFDRPITETLRSYLQSIRK